MKLRPPSLGFLYLLTTGLISFATISYITQPMFFEQAWGSREKDLGEARYLTRLASKATEKQRQVWLPEALALALKQADVALTSEILGQLSAAKVSEGEAGLLEVYPGVVWAFGLTEDGWTTGTKPGGLLIRNPDTNPHKLKLSFSNGGFNDKGRSNMQFVTGNKKTTVNLTEKSGEEKTVHVETATVNHDDVLVVSFRSYKPKQHKGRNLGIRFTGAEVVQ